MNQADTLTGIQKICPHCNVETTIARIDTGNGIAFVVGCEKCNRVFAITGDKNAVRTVSILLTDRLN